jgi:hypothetical protein
MLVNHMVKIFNMHCEEISFQEHGYVWRSPSVDGMNWEVGGVWINIGLPVES